MENPDKTVKLFEPENLTTIGLSQENEREEIQKAIRKSAGGKRVEIGVKVPSVPPSSIKPQQCAVIIPFHKVILRGRKKQKTQSINHQDSTESIEPAEEQTRKQKNKTKQGDIAAKIPTEASKETNPPATRGETPEKSKASKSINLATSSSSQNISQDNQ